MYSRHKKVLVFEFYFLKGTKPLIKRLKRNAVPSIFPHKEGPSVVAIQREKRVKGRNKRKESFKTETHTYDNIEVGAFEEIVHESPMDCSPDNTAAEVSVISKTLEDNSTQTPERPIMSVENYRHDQTAVHYYTGLEDYNKFNLVLATLGEAAYNLKYFIAKFTN